MKAAICIAGEPRSLKYTHENLRSTFEQHLDDYDIYIYAPECDTSDQIAKFFPEATTEIVKDEHIDERGISGWFKTGTQRYLQQVNGWKEVNRMRKDSGKDYDFIIRCRMDVYFQTPWVNFSKAKKDRIYIPNFHHWGGGINDRFCIASPDLIDNYLDVIDEAFKYPEHCHHAETFLRWSLINLNTPIELVPIYFDRIREDGTLEGDKKNEAVALHYPTELIRTGTYE